jgi:hypothetical protein
MRSDKYGIGFCRRRPLPDKAAARPDERNRANFPALLADDERQ